MQVELKIDAEAVQAQLVQSIISSSIGVELKKAIDKTLTEKTGGFYGKTLVERAVEEALLNVIRAEASKLVEAKKDEIRAQIAGRLTDEMLVSMTNAVWGVVDGRFKKLT